MDQTPQSLQAIRAANEEALAASFLLSLRRLQLVIPESKITELLSSGRPDLLLAEISEPTIQAAFQPFGEALTEAYVSSGKAVAAEIPPLPKAVDTFGQGVRVDTHVYFDQANPNLMGVLDQTKRSLIQGLTQETRTTVEQILSRALQGGINPIETAREIVGHIGLTPAQERAVSNFRQALENKPTEALNRALRDKRFDRSILNSKEKALKPEQIDKMVDRYRERYLKYRSQVIARTESIRSLSQSGQALWEDMADKGQVEEKRVRRFWIYTNDSRTRPTHRHGGIPTMNEKGVGLKEPFKAPGGYLIMFPGDPSAPPALTVQCRCTVFYKIDYLSD